MPHAEYDVYGPRSKATTSSFGSRRFAVLAALMPAASPPTIASRRAIVARTLPAAGHSSRWPPPPAEIWTNRAWRAGVWETARAWEAPSDVARQHALDDRGGRRAPARAAQPPCADRRPQPPARDACPPHRGAARARPPRGDRGRARRRPARRRQAHDRPAP